nr:anion permease [Fusobacterium ulcerans]
MIGIFSLNENIVIFICIRKSHTALAMPEIPLPVFCLMVGAAIGLGSILTPYATGPSPIYYGSGYLPTVDYWRLGAIFGLIFLVLLLATGLIWMPLVLL